MGGRKRDNQQDRKKLELCKKISFGLSEAGVPFFFRGIWLIKEKKTSLLGVEKGGGMRWGGGNRIGKIFEDGLVVHGAPLCARGAALSRGWTGKKHSDRTKVVEKGGSEHVLIPNFFC